MLGVIRRYLIDLQYEVVGWVDPVEELSFASPEMEALFHRIERGQAIDDTTAEKQDTAAPDPNQPKQPSAAKRTLDKAKDVLHLKKPAATDWHATIDRIARGLNNTQAPCAFIVNLASRIVASPDRPGKDELLAMTRLFKAALLSREVVRADKRWNNLIILVCEKMNDLPTFLFVNNPRSRTIQIELPDRDERGRFINRYFPYFFGARGAESTPPVSVVEDFVDMTENLTNFEMRSLVSMSVKERIPLLDPRHGPIEFQAPERNVQVRRHHQRLGQDSQHAARQRGRVHL